MPTPPAIDGTFVKIEQVASRKVARLHIEVPIERANEALAVLGGFPDPANPQWCAIAPLDVSAVKQQEPPAPKPKSRAQMAGILCGDARFQRFLSENYDRADNEEEAAVVVRSECCVYSRSEFDKHPNTCGARWDDLHAEFEAWLRT